jgi:hypothetical protein
MGDDGLLLLTMPSREEKRWGGVVRWVMMGCYCYNDAVRVVGVLCASRTVCCVQ